MKRQPFAVFDIDGTLIRWQLYHAVADELAEKGYFDDGAYTAVKVARRLWQERSSGSSFQDYEQALVTVVDTALNGIAVADATAAYSHVISQYKDQVYVYTRDLLRSLKQQHYLLFAISASQSDIVALLAKYYGFDDWGGTRYEVENGHFTGKKVLLRQAAKVGYLEQLISKHNATKTGSIAVGDSESDVAMLETVEQAIAFNPTRDLYAAAMKHHWKIVVERKNMIYELEHRDGSYRLA